jgi:DNA-binding response OmpR family regulator
MTRALVIDDDEIARELCVDSRDGGYEAFELPRRSARHGRSPRKIEIVVLDIAMPDLSGDRGGMLRARPRPARLGIVLVSRPIEELRRRCVGADGWC